MSYYEWPGEKSRKDMNFALTKLSKLVHGQDKVKILLNVKDFNFCISLFQNTLIRIFKKCIGKQV